MAVYGKGKLTLLSTGRGSLRWYQALERAGIQDFRWHDLRHTWASWHVQNGTPLFALQELGGLESSEMVRRYAHLSAEHLTPFADRLYSSRLVANSDGNVLVTGKNKRGRRCANPLIKWRARQELNPRPPGS
jgi:integrase-like protein